MGMHEEQKSALICTRVYGTVSYEAYDEILGFWKMGRLSNEGSCTRADTMRSVIL